MTLAAGPFAQIPIADGYAAPFYALRFDKDGRCLGPQTRQVLVGSLPGDFTDVFVFCHGWNNDWGTALERYQDFFKAFHTLVTEHQLDLGRAYRPLLIGIFWPSTALVMPGERGPQFAGGDDEDPNESDLPVMDELSLAVPEDQRDRYYDLLDRPALDEEESKELLALLGAVFMGGDQEIPDDAARDVEDARAAWAMYQAATEPRPRVVGSPDGFGQAGQPRPGGDQPHPAGFLDKLDPRKLIRMLTVYQMKDRAGVIGTKAIGPLLHDLLDKASEETRFHLIGHSYGARVHLNAVSRPEGGPLPRPVDSLLLLQPAVNHLCFADHVDGHPGGYTPALPMVRQPILSTFSHHDFPLHDTFHLSLRRGKDVGEIGIASDEPPSKYAALGGYGPRGFDKWKQVDIKLCPDPYDLSMDAPEVWAIKGGDLIKSHSDVVSPATAWALYNLVMG